MSYSLCLKMQADELPSVNPNSISVFVYSFSHCLLGGLQEEDLRRCWAAGRERRNTLSMAFVATLLILIASQGGVTANSSSRWSPPVSFHDSDKPVTSYPFSLSSSSSSFWRCLLHFLIVQPVCQLHGGKNDYPKKSWGIKVGYFRPKNAIFRSRQC